MLVLYSYHHNNTKKIANVFSKILNAPIRTPQQIDPEEINQYELVGLGAGIDSGKHYKPILDFADNMPKGDNKKVFIFSTAGLTGNKKLSKDHSVLREKLESKGYIIVDEFQCKGHNTNSFLKYFGGMNRGRPNSKDLKNAEVFIQKLKQNIKKIDLD